MLLFLKILSKKYYSKNTPKIYPKYPSKSTSKIPSKHLLFYSHFPHPNPPIKPNPFPTFPHSFPHIENPLVFPIYVTVYKIQPTKSPDNLTIYYNPPTFPSKNSPTTPAQILPLTTTLINKKVGKSQSNSTRGASNHTKTESLTPKH